MQALPASARASLLLTGVVIVAWLVWAVREYRRTGRGTWLWMGILMAVSLAVVLLRVA